MRKYLPFIIIIVLSWLLVNPLFRPGYFLHHDDLQVMRIYEMRRCFTDLQLPCRWVPDMGYGYGYPLFNFYSVFPYYIGGILSFGMGYIGAAKALFFIPLIFGYIFMFLLGRELFGSKVGFVVATAYAFAPYRALDSYVRGAIAESFALMLFPLILFFGYRLTQNYTRLNFLGVTLSLAAFLTTHNIMTLLFMPIYGSFMLVLLIFNKWNNFKGVFISGILSFGIAAFFLLPAFLEKSLVQIDTLTMGGSDFRAHFITLNQLFFSRYWGYGQSVFGPNDTLSFQIGWPYWWLVAVAAVITFVSFIALKFSKFKSGLSFIFNILDPKFLVLELLFLIVFLGSIFMTHYQSAFIWEALDIIHFAQFPWRFLSLTILSASLIIGFLLISVKRIQNILIVVIVIATLAFNYDYFHPGEYYYNITEKEKFSGDLWDIQQKAGILDYLPKTAYEPKKPAPSHPIVSTNSAIIKDFDNHSNRFSFGIDAKEKTDIVVPVFEFPQWQVLVNGKVINHKYPNGFISFSVEPGEYNVEGKFNNTIVRTVANVISLMSVITLIIFTKKSRFGK